MVDSVKYIRGDGISNCQTYLIWVVYYTLIESKFKFAFIIINNVIQWQKLYPVLLEYFSKLLKQDDGGSSVYLKSIYHLNVIKIINNKILNSIISLFKWLKWPKLYKRSHLFNNYLTYETYLFCCIFIILVWYYNGVSRNLSLNPDIVSTMFFPGFFSDI